MKNILFGIALILFGFICIYVAVQGGWGGLDVFGIIIGVCGLMFSISGLIEKRE